MHRFFLPPEQTKGKTIVLSTRETHHALNVLRLRTGDQVTVLDGAGQRILCAVRAMDKHVVTVEEVKREKVAPLPYQLTLLQCVPKGKTMDTIVQKATELGAHRIVPILSERTITQVDEGSAAHKVEKWTAVAVEAIKQCGSTWLPKIEAPVTPQAFLKRGEAFNFSLVGSLHEGARHPREHLEEYLREKQSLPTTACVWVGPEGDFTPAEMAMLQGAGVLPITLGPLVLRSDTAAIYCLSVLSYELQAGR